MKHFVLFLCLLCFLARMHAQLPGTYTVSGYVKDVCGNPTDAYSIKLRDKRGMSFWAGIDRTGRFELKSVRPGKYRVMVWSNRFNVQSTDSITVTDEPLCHVEITMQRAGYVTPIPQEPAYLLSNELKHIPDRNNVLCGIGMGTVQRGDEVSIYGTRGGGYVLYIDGIKMRHSRWVPQASIQEVDVWLMGIPANLDYSR